MIFVKPEGVKALAITLLSFVAQSFCTHATTYYVSSSQGNDNNAGTSASAPWATVGKVYNAGIVSRFKPSDSILLKSGDTFSGMLWVLGNGSNGAPITISSYGTGGNPIINGDEANVVWTNVTGYVGMYAAVPSFASQVTKVADTNGNLYTKLNQGTNTLATWLGSFTKGNWGYSGSSKYLIYIRTLDGNPPRQMRLFLYCAVQLSAPYTIVEKMDIRRAFYGIILGATNCIARNNSIQDVFCGAIYPSVPVNQDMGSNTITRCGYTGISLVGGRNNWVHHNNISCAASNILGIAINGAELCGIGLQQGTNNLVEYNTVSNVVMSCFDFWLETSSTIRYNYGVNSGSGAYPDGTGLRFYGNIFSKNPVGIGGGHDYNSVKSAAPDAGPNLIYNNIFYGFTTNYGLYSAPGDSSRSVVRNNIFVATSSTVNLVNVNSGMDIDYNTYYCTTGAPRAWYWNNTRYNTLAAFQAASGQDRHSFYLDPQFVSANPVSAADFKLRSTSPCINAGQDLKLAGLLAPTQQYQDFLGRLIPQGSGADIGPYEASSLLPASGLHVISQ